MFENLEKKRIDFNKNIYVPYSHRPNKIMHYQSTDLKQLYNNALSEYIFQVAK